MCVIMASLINLCATAGHPNMGGPMRMNPPRGMGGMGPQVGHHTQKKKKPTQNHCFGTNQTSAKASNDLWWDSATPPVNFLSAAASQSQLMLKLTICKQNQCLVALH